MTDVDLARFGRRIRIGKKGDVKLSGEGILDRHAEIVVGPDRAAWLRSTGGDVWVARGALRELLTRPRRLLDGDIIIVGHWQMQYKNLMAKPADVNERKTAWMR